MKPRRRGYQHRALIAVVDGVGVTEGGEVVGDLTTFAMTADTHVWVTVDPAHLLNLMLARFSEVPAFNYQLVHSEEVEDTGVHMNPDTRLTRFGFKCRCAKGEPCTCGNPGGRKQAMHTVWSVGDMARNPADFLDGFTHAHLLTWAQDVREWCSEQDIPLPTSLAGIASSLMRDSRFWPDARGRVPTATNERIRPWLPGVFAELRTDPGTSHQAIAIDQRTAYHRAAQEVATPDPTTLFARGYFASPEDSPVWAARGTPVYERTMRQPGVAYVVYDARPLLKHETRPPAIKPGRGRAAVWTNEVTYLEQHGVNVTGIVAAWTSCDADQGLPRYGAFAQDAINAATEERKRWLKPTLHSLYGLSAMRTRKVTIGHHRGRGQQRTMVLGAGHEFTVAAHELPTLPAATVNVALLGVLQAEIRRRSLAMAYRLSMDGCTILHIHADGIHVAGDLPLLTEEWSIKPRSNLMYLDRVSWTSDQGDTLPGRDERDRVELRRHLARLHQAVRERAS